MLGYLTKNDQDIVIKLAKKIKDLLGNQLVLLEIFGSKIRGDFTLDSDIDLLIIVKDKDIKLKNKLYDTLFEIDPYFEYKISLIIYSAYEYDQNVKLKSPFIENLQKEAVRL